MSSESSNQTPLLIYQNREIGLANLLRLIAAIEHTLQKFELEFSKPVNRLAFNTQDRFLSALLIYLSAFSGRTIMPLASHLSKNEQRVLCEEAVIDLLICDDGINDAGFAIINSAIITEAIDVSVKNDSAEYFLSQDIHKNFKLIIATSGTTSRAKLVLLDRDNILAHVNAIQRRLYLNESHCWLNCMPFNNIAGVMILFRCLLTGASHIVTEGFNANKLWHDIMPGKVSHISLVPIMLSRLLEVSSQQTPPDSFKMILLGGDRVSDKLFAKAQQADWPMLISYGMSEAASTVALSDDNHRYKMLDGLEIAFNDSGAIKIKGPAVMKTGYLNSIPREPIFNQQGWFITHDFGEPDDRGFMVYGRQNNTFTSGGQTVSLESAEQKLVKCPLLNEFRLATVKHDDWGDTLVAFVDGDIHEIEKWCQQNLHSLYRPRYFFMFDQLPTNEMGKMLNENLRLLVDQMIASNNNSPT